MLHALQRLHGEFAFTVDVVDVDADEGLVAKYDERVPVLVGHRGTTGAAAASQDDGIEICHYFLDEAKVRAFLAPA
jgi:hypothetical protein